MESKYQSRRDFVKKTIGGASAVAFGGVLAGFTPKSYRNIAGANEKIRVAMMGVNGRGLSLSRLFSAQPNCEIIYVCDVDKRAANRCIAMVEEIQKRRPEEQPDFRKALEDPHADALVIAAPDHWHAPAGILACKAGKHVYIEKPCSHNPHEGEVLVAAAGKYKRVVQMGNQRRSWPNVATAIHEIRNGIIGRPYFAKGWYSNNRESIGTGKETGVPSWLNWDLWQGPAPRRSFRDNFLHYNWHWFWHWGTGEALNNGTHMIDLMRWGLDVSYPVRVSSSGGRYRYKDDWETPDTQIITLEFDNNTSMVWEGRSCNGGTVEGTAVGVIFYGETGSVLIDGNAYKVFDLKNNLVKEASDLTTVDPRDTSNPGGWLNTPHVQNFFDGITKGTPVTSDILGGHQSTLLCQLGNIALRSGGPLQIDPENGHILHNQEAMKYWKREYQRGWEL